ncbi:MAG: hypothetical protein ACXWF8_09980 [Methylobacter sp.]
MTIKINAVQALALALLLGGIIPRAPAAERPHVATVETQGLDTVLDIPLRLGGLVSTLVGAGLFVGTSPITGLMTVLPPHNAIAEAGEFLVVRPGKYTFVRPSGNFYYDARPGDEK